MPTFHATAPVSRRALQTVVFTLCVTGVVIALAATFYVRGKTLMEYQIVEKLRDAAAIAALQFDAELVESIKGRADMGRPQVADMVRRLRKIRDEVEDIRYAYIMRRTDDPLTLQFVADADSFATPMELDDDHDGTVEEHEQGSYPGDLYDITDITAMQEEAFLRPTVDAEITHDQWGTWISGYAPIRDYTGKTVAILGLDMDASEYVALGRSVFSPMLTLLTCLAALLLAGYVIAYLGSLKVESLRRTEEERVGMLRLTSHQLGELLTIFQWSLEDLRGKNVSPDDHAQAVQNVDTGVRRLKHILSVLRSAARLEANEFPYKPEPMYIRDVIVEAVHGVTELLTEKNQRVAQDVDPNLRCSMDRHLIGNVIRELLQNASDFSPMGSSIAISARAESGKAVVKVLDRGCGIPKKDLPRIFGKFVRGGNAHLARPDGYGLGLFMAQRIVERAGGKIWIESDEGKGTTVSFSLPL